MKADLQSLSFEGAKEWLNGRAETRQTKGHPTLVHFWSISSETAKNNLSQIAALRDHRKREGLRVVAVHVPQTEATEIPALSATPSHDSTSPNLARSTTITRSSMPTSMNAALCRLITYLIPKVNYAAPPTIKRARDHRRRIGRVVSATAIQQSVLCGV